MDTELLPQFTQALEQYTGLIRKHPDIPISKLLPLLLQLRGKPYSLAWSHFMFEPIYRIRNLSRRLVIKSARQVGKSQSLSAAQIIRSSVQPNYNVLTVMPLFEQVRKFSQNYVRPFISTSPIRNWIVNGVESDSVLQRSVGRNSNLFFSYSSGDPNRVRGVPADELDVDECIGANTYISVPGGAKPILSIQAGDEILAFSETGELVKDLVVCVKAKGVRSVYQLYIASGETLTCTENEKLWTSKGWKYLSQLLTDHTDVLLFTGNPAYPRIKSTFIERIVPAEEQEVYDIETERYHTFFANGIAVHNCQDMDMSDIPIIESCLAASPFKVQRFTGTPKTYDNTLQLLWQDSSQGIWHIPCLETGCKHLNRCSVDNGRGDLLKMLGDTPDRFTLLCAKCGHPVNSRLGYFVHDFPERRLDFAGYHVPQPILPMHYESRKDWKILLDFQRDKPKYIFFNETLGESFDVGAKLLTGDELRKAAQVTPVTPDTYPSGKYVMTALGIDWGGRGKEKTSDTDDFISNTAMALGGLRTDGVIEISWLYKVPYEVNIDKEARLAVQAAAMAHADIITLDHGGQGNVQEQNIVGAGWPLAKIYPFAYNVLNPARPIVFFTPPKHRGVRSCYTLDKPRSLMLLCELIKRGEVLLPSGDKYMTDHLQDFMNIYEETVARPNGNDRRLVKRMLRRTDDIVHAINFIVMSIYSFTGKWPTVASAFVDPVEYDDV